MRLLSFLTRDRTRSDSPPSDHFDLFHRKTMDAIIDSRGRPLSEWSVEDAEAPQRAARVVLGALRDRAELRRRFGNALAVAGPYRAYLQQRGAAEFRLSSSMAANVDAVFAQQPGAAVREYYRHTAWLQNRYPLALLPIGQKRFVKWLFGKGRPQHGFTDEQILWFLHETAEDVALGIAETYLLNPEWQERFPYARSGWDQPGLLDWLRREYPKFAPFRAVTSLPRLRPLEAIASGAASPGVNVLSHFCYPSGIQQAALATKAGSRPRGSRRRVATCLPGCRLRSRRARIGSGSRPFR
jgi:hypothetical protein